MLKIMLKYECHVALCNWALRQTSAPLDLGANSKCNNAIFVTNDYQFSCLLQERLWTTSSNSALFARIQDEGALASRSRKLRKFSEHVNSPAEVFRTR